MKKDYEDTVRVEHVALFGWLNAEQASKVNKAKYQDLRIELIGPEYKAWQFGDEQSENSIKGNASDWCRLSLVGFLKVINLHFQLKVILLNNSLNLIT